MYEEVTMSSMEIDIPQMNGLLPDTPTSSSPRKVVQFNDTEEVRVCRLAWSHSWLFHAVLYGTRCPWGACDCSGLGLAPSYLCIMHIVYMFTSRCPCRRLFTAYIQLDYSCGASTVLIDTLCAFGYVLLKLTCTTVWCPCGSDLCCDSCKFS